MPRVGRVQATERGEELRATRQPALDRRRRHRADHLSVLRDRLPRALAGAVRPGRRALVGGLHRRLRAAAAGRAAALADGLREPGSWRRRSATRCGSRRRSSSRSRSPSTWSPWRCGRPIQDHLLHGNSTLYWIGVAAITAYGASYFARGFLAGSHRLTIYALLIISESVSRTAFPFAVALGIASGQTAVALGIVAAPTLSLIVVPFAFLRRFGSEVEPAPADGEGEVQEAAPNRRVHARTRWTVRGRRLPDHALRADVPERRAPAGQRQRRRRGRGLHLQRADDRPGAAPALPGGPDEPPPPPHHAPAHRETRRTSAPRSASRSWRSPASRRWSRSRC